MHWRQAGCPILTPFLINPWIFARDLTGTAAWIVGDVEVAICAFDSLTDEDIEVWSKAD